MESMPADLVALVKQRYGIQGSAMRVAAGISGSELWMVDSPQPTLVRVSKHYDLQHMERVARSVARLQRDLPEVIAPCPADDGGYVCAWNDRPVTVWPFITGTVLDRTDPHQVIEAAQMLARLHQVSVEGGPTDPNDDIPGADNAGAAAALLPDPTLDERIDQWRARAGRRYDRGWRHGDFFEQNILCRDRTVVAIVDWDDVSVGSTDVELAWSVWEFGKSSRGDRLMPRAASAFLSAYRLAGGRHTPVAELVPLMRERLRRDIAFSAASPNLTATPSTPPMRPINSTRSARSARQPTDLLKTLDSACVSRVRNRLF